MPRTKFDAFLEAEVARLNGRHEEALARYREALALEPGDWKIREHIADELVALDDLKGALKELFTAAQRLIWQKAFADATRLLQRMLQIDPRRQFDVTRGVQTCLDDVAAAMDEDADELPVDGDWSSTGEFLNALVLADTSEGFRVPRELLDAEPAPPPAPPRRLTLKIDRTPTIAMQGKELLIGRGKDCHLRLASGVVSRHHSRILEMDGHYLLFNWESKNGTLLNGRAIDQEELHEGDVVTFGLSGPQATVHLG